MKKYYGNYLGIVIGSGDDPENRNRIQVWIPHITNTLYDGWNNNPNIGNIDFFNFLQGNNTPNKELQDRIRNVLPWAECASPLFGGGSPVTQNLSNGQSSINSANTLGESSRTSIFDDLTDPLLPVEGDDGGLDIEPEPPEPENEEIEQGSSVASEDSGTVSDIAANNAKGSADGLPPVEPELPSDDYYPTPATGNFPSSSSTGETSTTLLDLQTPAQDQPVSLVLQELPWPAAPEGIVVGASPFSFSPGFDGFTTITGGTVSAITLSRDGGATIFSTGLLLGVFPLSLSDTLTITYSVVPTVTFFRRG